MLNVSVAALRFVDDVAAQLPGAVGARERALHDAYALLMATIWSDGRIESGEESIAKAAAQHGVRPSHDGLRRTSPLLAELVRLDATDGGGRAALYAERALSLVSAAMLLDSRIDPSELDAMRHFRGLLGSSVRPAQIRAPHRLVGQERAMQRLASLRPSPATMDAAIVGSPGTGRHTLAELICQRHVAAGVIAGGQIVRVDAADWLSAATGRLAGRHGAEVAVGAVQRASGGFLVVDHAELLYNEVCWPALRVLGDAMSASGRHGVVLLAQTAEQLRPLADIHANVRAVVDAVWQLDELGPAELVTVFEAGAAQAGFAVSAACRIAVLNRFLAEGPDRPGGAARARALLEAAVGLHTAAALTGQPVAPDELGASDLPD